MSVAQKLRKAREAQSGRPTQGEVAGLLGIASRNYQKYELGKVKGPKTIDPIIKALSAEWDIPVEWFYDGRDSDPYAGGLPPSWAKHTQITVYHAKSPSPPAYGVESSHMGRIDYDVAALHPIAMELPDDRLGPRIPAGWTIYGVAKRRIAIAKAYIATHKHRTVMVGDTELPELVAGIYVSRPDGFFLEPPGLPETRENVQDLNELHLIVARAWPLDDDWNWYLLEKNIRHGLSMAPLPVRFAN